MTNELPLKPLSRHQYGTLKFINESNVTLAYLRHAHANTLGSLAQRGYLQKEGSHDNSRVVLTKSGLNALGSYMTASMNERSHEGDLTERCMRLLRVSRSRMLNMDKAS